MELIRISNQKIKIMLTATDMIHFDLDAGALTDDSVRLHHSFCLLLEEIKKQIDFDADFKELSVQYFPSRGGGCEMFISHLSERSAGEGRSALQPLTDKRQLGVFKREYTYCFAELSLLLSACKRLTGISAVEESEAFADERGRCFLVLSVSGTSPFELPGNLQFLNEYGHPESTASARIYLSEHGISLCSNSAVEQLSAFA